MSATLRYPIGQQDFNTLRNEGCVYIDKTRFIEKLLSRGSRYYFLARPRRFGKSLFLSTLQYFFEGRKDLFDGLYIRSADWDWKPFPVLRLDLNTERYAQPGLLDKVLDNVFNKWEAEYGIMAKAETLPSRFQNIIEAAYKQTGQQVVILVDEYDKPLVTSLNTDENFEHYRARLASLYSNFKSSAEHIRLVFLTGVSRFSKLSIFSDLNNLKDISFDDDFADICGITEKEMKEHLHPGIQDLAEKLNITCDEAYSRLKKNYDGYKFAEKGSDIYNPWSLLNCLDSGKIMNYWNHTGKPTIIAEALKRIDADIEDTLNSVCDLDTLSGFDLSSPDPIALMYQTGYLTIKNHDSDTGLLSLGIPNLEVKDAVFMELLPYYVNVKSGGTENTVRKITNSILLGKPAELMTALEAFFAGIPYDLKMDNENNFHNALYILVSLIGVNARAEEHTSDGSIDLLIETPKFVYLIELKYNGTSRQALDQINDKKYARKYLTDNRRIFKIGATFSSTTRTIESPLIEPVS